MNTADAAGGEHGHTGAGGERDRRRHGGDTDVECGGVGMPEISGGDLRGAAEHPLDLVVGDTDHRTPSSTAVIAGTAPAARITASQRSRHSRLAGSGRPKAL